MNNSSATTTNCDPKRLISKSWDVLSAAFFIFCIFSVIGSTLENKLITQKYIEIEALSSPTNKKANSPWRIETLIFELFIKFIIKFCRIITESKKTIIKKICELSRIKLLIITKRFLYSEFVCELKPEPIGIGLFSFLSFFFTLIFFLFHFFY